MNVPGGACQDTFLLRGSLKLKFIAKLFFLLDSSLKFCLNISVKRLVTSPKLLSHIPRAAAFFCLQIHCFVFSRTQAQPFGLLHLKNIGPLMQF
jgi:hypothetical protein